jgi:hypothetical protein
MRKLQQSSADPGRLMSGSAIRQKEAKTVGWTRNHIQSDMLCFYLIGISA